ncbi:PAS domain S-box-containing protein/diguanylate cyclase (GGDEF) domain-containing protein [Marinobacter daqiaonensis]|uniref:cyclic-guanylate-specific phosphodiesterase n=1 Tax=Marinobacter daqiaonensis TaxID=650891 RepID=A0A1I6GLL2_9GAMM|nr:EAL domain-containing protein [Marinobacter daqiaonensis]SFR43112.1 PAS domain S-box-containing protein/diguanylate cyclase (GGDEF) domain-containing protein [Marinobacter daqiaonensis]
MLSLFSRLKQFRQGSPLSFRLLAYILLFSSAFTLIATGIQIYGDFRKDLAAIEERFEVVETSYSSSLARSLWALDQNLLQVQLEGILSLPDIVHLRLRIYPDSELVIGDRPERDAAIRQHSFEITHDGTLQTELGELTITASLARTYQELERKIWVILTTQFLKTFLISILIVWIFRHLVTRHLTRMANYARDFSLQSLDSPLTLDRPDTRRHRRDELGQVTEAFNHMRQRLREDLSRQARDEAEIRKLSKAVEQSPSSVMICDRQWRIEFVNQKFTQLTGYAAADVLNKQPGDLPMDARGMRDSQQLWQTIRLQVQRVGVWQGEVHSVRRNGDRFWEQLVVTAIKDADSRISNYLVVGEDISIRKRYEQQLLRQANYDILTGLPNRMLALDRLKLALAQAHRESTQVGVMFLDLDNFKHINDTLGHDAGDHLLVEAARRVSACLRGTSTVARLGGDEFLVVLPGLKEPQGAEMVADRILKAFGPPFLLSGQEVFVTTSIGIAIYPTDSDNTGTLLQHADAAMYEAKHKGKSSWERFAPAMKEVSHERLQMESRLRRALELDEFELWYQPIVETQTGRVTGAEALLRWKSPAMGLVMPDRFIPLAEETGMIIPIGRWVLEQACAAMGRVEQATGLALNISVNVSPRQFRDPEFVATTLQTLADTGMDPQRVELEITERLILDNTIETAAILNQLDTAGLRLSVDDFGTGFSALSYLKSYPFDTLKVDKSFIADVLVSVDDASLVRAIITMAHSLNLRVIAEGVEEDGQTRFLQDLRCDYAQGYFYSRPVPEAEFLDWLRASPRGMDN